jgi:hypothetical protein
VINEAELRLQLIAVLQYSYTTLTNKKKFWEELIAYFPLILLHGQQRKRRLQQFFVAAGTCLPSRCLATIRGQADRRTDSPLIRYGPYSKRRVQQLFYYCVYIRCHGDILTEPLPSNIHIQTYRLMRVIYEVRR